MSDQRPLPIGGNELRSSRCCRISSEEFAGEVDLDEVLAICVSRMPTIGKSVAMAEAYGVLLVLWREGARCESGST